MAGADPAVEVRMTPVATGLRFPEGPIALRDGSVLLARTRRVPEHAPLVTDICFAGAGSRTAYVTSSGRGVLYTLDRSTDGLDLAFAA